MCETSFRLLADGDICMFGFEFLRGLMVRLLLSELGRFRRPGGEFLFHVEKEPKDARGAAQDGHFVSIFAVPLEPPLRGLPLEVGRVVPARKI